MTRCLRRRLNGIAHDDRGTIPMLMIVMLVGIGLTALLMPVLLNMRSTTNFSATRVRDLNAAQSGIDVVMGKIRNATDSTGTGDPSQLPCTKTANGKTNAPLTGTVSSGNGDTTSYSVLIDYYIKDPVANAGDTSLQPMQCVPGSGPYDSSTNTVTPSFAKITSTGTDAGTNGPNGATGRTLTTVYSFEVDNSNISGGTIRIYPDSTNDGANTFCLDAGSATPAINTVITVQACSSNYPPLPQQTWAYRTDLTLQLVSSVGSTVAGTTYRTGLCIDLGSTSNGKPVIPSTLVLKQCGALGSPVWSQQWAFDGYAQFQAAISTSASTGTLSGDCIYMATPHAAGSIKLTTCANSFPSLTTTWVSSPAVGAGDAQAGGYQYVNFQEFGECIHDPHGTWNFPYLIAGSCLQNPKQSAIPWNQVVTWNSSTKYLSFTNSTNGTSYCIYSPLTPASDTNSIHRLVLLTPCSSHSGVSTSAMQWTRTTPATNPTVPYSQQYRFIDSSGQCLTPTTITSAIPGDDVPSQYTYWDKLIVTTCNYSTLQQWNASNNVGDSAVENTSEN